MHDEDSDHFQSADEGFDVTPLFTSKDASSQDKPILSTTTAVSSTKAPRAPKKSTPGEAKKKMKKRKGLSGVKKTSTEEVVEEPPIRHDDSSAPVESMKPTINDAAHDLPTIVKAASRSSNAKKSTAGQSSKKRSIKKKDPSLLEDVVKPPVSTNLTCTTDSVLRSPTLVLTASECANSISSPTDEASKKSFIEEGNSSVAKEPIRSVVTANTKCLGDPGELLHAEQQGVAEGGDSVLSTDQNVPIEQHAPTLDQLSSTAGALLKGVGEGLNTLADTIIQPLYHTFPVNQCDNEELAARRRQRKEEEETERKAVSEAWSNVWDTAWGIDDGWEVEDDPTVETERTECENETETKSGVQTLNSKMQELTTKEDDHGTAPSSMWDWSGVSSLAQQLTSSLQSTSLQLVQESVGVLERIGKKTMSVIEENDPGFRHTKKLLHPTAFADRPSLSQLIREAQERDRHTCDVSKSEKKSSDKTGFLSELESQRGLVHLEALELVGERAVAQLHARLYSSTHSHMAVHQDNLDKIWNTLQMEGENTDELDESASHLLSEPSHSLPHEHSRLWHRFQQSLLRLKSIYSGDRLLRLTSGVWDDVSSGENIKNAQELCRQAGRSLATLTSGLLEYLHKLAECALVQNSDLQLDYINLVAVLELGIRSFLDLEGHLCDKYVNLMKSASTHSSPNSSPDMKSPVPSTSQLVANLLLDCGNAQNYIRDATRLLAPVFQLAYVESYSSDS